MDVLALVGPTGTGKTTASLELAASLGGEIVCGDSRQLFRGLDVATGKPTAEERSRFPHHLFEWLEPGETPSAGLYARAAAPIVEAVRGRGRVPIVVGGSGLYLRALARGLAPIPPVSEDVRRRVRRDLAERGPESLHEELRALDPALAARLAPRDGQRVARGLEVARGTGRPLSAWIAEQSPIEVQDLGQWLFVGLTLERRELFDRLDRRAEGFFDGGLLEETRALLARGVSADAPGLRSLGYAQAVAHLQGKLTRQEAVERAQLETRRYAKRQWTWWRQEGPRVDLVWLETSARETPGETARRVAALWQARAPR